MFMRSDPLTIFTKLSPFIFNLFTAPMAMPLTKYLKERINNHNRQNTHYSQSHANRGKEGRRCLYCRPTVPAAAENRDFADVHQQYLDTVHSVVVKIIQTVHPVIQ